MWTISEVSKEYGEKQQENLSRQQNEGAGNIEENMFAEEFIEHSGVEVADEETDVLAQTDESVEEKVTENHDDEVIEQAEKFEKSDLSLIHI